MTHLQQIRNTNQTSCNEGATLTQLPDLIDIKNIESPYSRIILNCSTAHGQTMDLPYICHYLE